MINLCFDACPGASYTVSILALEVSELSSIRRSRVDKFWSVGFAASPLHFGARSRVVDWPANEIGRNNTTKRAYLPMLGMYSYAASFWKWFRPDRRGFGGTLNLFL